VDTWILLGPKAYFVCNSWLSIEISGSLLQKSLKVFFSIGSYF